jgi:hypothetical protein
VCVGPKGILADVLSCPRALDRQLGVVWEESFASFWHRVETHTHVDGYDGDPERLVPDEGTPIIVEPAQERVRRPKGHPR